MTCRRRDHNQSRLVLGRRAASHEKHGEQSIEAIPHDAPAWMPILVEEVGEVAHALTYDGDLSQLADELVDVMAVCGAWLDALRVAGVHPDARGTWLA